jgi:hypothetical protein
LFIVYLLLRIVKSKRKWHWFIHCSMHCAYYSIWHINKMSKYAMTEYMYTQYFLLCWVLNLPHVRQALYHLAISPVQEYIFWKCN